MDKPKQHTIKISAECGTIVNDLIRRLKNDSCSLTKPEIIEFALTELYNDIDEQMYKKLRSRFLDEGEYLKKLIKNGELPDKIKRLVKSSQPFPK